VIAQPTDHCESDTGTRKLNPANTGGFTAVKVARLQMNSASRAVVRTDERYLDRGYSDIGEFLCEWRSGPSTRPMGLPFTHWMRRVAPVIPRPGKVVCRIERPITDHATSCWATGPKRTIVICTAVPATGGERTITPARFGAETMKDVAGYDTNGSISAQTAHSGHSPASSSRSPSGSDVGQWLSAGRRRRPSFSRPLTLFTEQLGSL